MSGQVYPPKLMSRYAICFVCFKRIPYVAPTLRRHRKESGLSIIVMEDGTGVRKDICDGCKRKMMSELAGQIGRKAAQIRATAKNSPPAASSGGEGKKTPPGAK